MSTQNFLLICLQALFIQLASCQYFYGNSEGVSNFGRGSVNEGNIGIPNGNCLAKAEVLVPNGVFNGGVITELVPNLQFGDITMTGDLPIGGSIKVCGCFPVYGTVAVDGCVPSSGSAAVNTGCSKSKVLDNSCRCSK